jgi:hypothetical protein
MNELNNDEKKFIKYSELNFMSNNLIINNITKYEYKYKYILYKIFKIKFYINRDLILYILKYLNFNTLLIIKSDKLTKNYILKKYNYYTKYKNKFKYYGLLYINNKLCECFKLNFLNINNQINNKKIYNKNLKKNIYTNLDNNYIKYINISFNYDFIFKFYNKNIFNRQIKNINLTITIKKI